MTEKQPEKEQTTQPAETPKDPPAAASAASAASASSFSTPQEKKPKVSIQPYKPEPLSTPRDDASSVSNLTVEGSVISRTSASIVSVLSQSLQILKGELPEEDRNDYNPEDDRPNPTKSISFGQSPMEFSEEDAETASLISIDFLQDDHKEMTSGRRIALSLINKTWYNPRAGETQEEITMNGNDDYDETTGQEKMVDTTTHDNGNNAPLSPQSGGTAGYPARVTERQFPSLERAWAYFEHVALPRYIARQKPNARKKNICVRLVRKLFMKADKQLDKAEPGENHLPTKLYSPIFTPLKQMGDFGLGIGLYFSTLRAITVLTLLAGLINIVNFQYFSSNEYSLGQENIEPITLLGSAICTNKVWVPCPDCNLTNWKNDADKLGFVQTTNVFGDDITLTFALHNDCEGVTLQQGMVNYGTLMFVLVGILVMNIYQKHMEIKYDEDEQTAQDYSIVITNPPHDAHNPQEWRNFFHDNFHGAHTTTCTIAVDNDLLVRSLQERRECMRKIEMLVEPGTSLDDLNLARIAAEIERGRNVTQNLLAMVAPGIPELFGRATVLTAKIQGLAQQDYPVSNVFLSFETEAAQRQVLTALSVGAIAANHNNVRVHHQNPEFLFRGDIVLRVMEPDEPSTVRWRDLNVKFLARLKQLVITTLATLLSIVIIAFLIWALHDVNVGWAAIAIAAANGIFPTFAKLLTLGESHASEGGKQTSLYFKIAIFRWANTAIIITIITVRVVVCILMQRDTSADSFCLVAAFYKDA